MSPEKLHLILAHFPIAGLALAMLPILYGLLLDNRSALLSGLVLATLSAWTTPFLMDSGETAYERYIDGEVTAYLDADANIWLNEHNRRAHDWGKLLYLTAVLLTLASVLVLLKSKHARPVTCFALAFCLIALMSAIWIADSGGKIRRPDFRVNFKYEPQIEVPLSLASTIKPQAAG